MSTQPSRRPTRRSYDRSTSLCPQAHGGWVLIKATVFNDAGCPWGYSANPAFRVLEWRYGGQIEWRLVVIGLRDEVTPAMRDGLTRPG